VVNPQHATRSRLILYWKLPPPSGSSCIGKDYLLTSHVRTMIVVTIWFKIIYLTKAGYGRKMSPSAGLAVPIKSRWAVVCTAQTKRPLKRNAMTIAAGFPCKDGLILCADTQEVISGYVK